MLRCWCEKKENAQVRVCSLYFLSRTEIPPVSGCEITVKRYEEQRNKYSLGWDEIGFFANLILVV